MRRSCSACDMCVTSVKEPGRRKRACAEAAQAVNASGRAATILTVSTQLCTYLTACTLLRAAAQELPEQHQDGAKEWSLAELRGGGRMRWLCSKQIHCPCRPSGG